MTTGPVAMQFDNKSCLQFEDNLLARIPNDITLNSITPKLSWRDFYTLSSLSRAWRHAVRSRQVYNESFRSHSTETFLPSYCTSDTIALFSTRENSWYKLPPILYLRPDVCGGQIRIPPWSQCVSLNGKVYVLGGRINCETANRVFVFDVVGGGQWERCASMRDPREGFECAVKDGKIYVFGGKIVTTCGLEASDQLAHTGRALMKGTTVTTLVSASEVYDPNKDAWSPIKPMKTFRCGHVASVGEELFVQIGGSLSAYHPLKDEWRVVSNSWRWPEKQLFTAQGKFHSLHGIRSRGDWLFMDESLAIHSYDVHEDSWTNLHSFSFDGILPDGYVVMYPEAILALEEELVAIVRWITKKDQDSRRGMQGQCLLQSKGFGSEDKEISWELIDFSFADLPHSTRYFIHKL